jgi:hypothetical protein
MIFSIMLLEYFWLTCSIVAAVKYGKTAFWSGLTEENESNEHKYG